MNGKRLKALFFGLVVLFCLGAVRVAGAEQWVIQREDSDGSGVVEYYAQDFFRYQTKQTDVIFHLDSRKVTIIKPELKVFATGRSDELHKLRQKRRAAELERFFEEKVADLPDEEKKTLRQAWEEHLQRAERRAALSNLRIEVNATNQTAEIVGYKTVKQQIWVNGELVEEWWLSPEVRPMDQIDIRLLDKMWASLEKTGPEPDYTRSVQVRILWREGYPLRRVRYLGGLVLNSEVLNVHKGKWGPPAMALPEGLKKVSFEELLGLTKGDPL